MSESPEKSLPQFTPGPWRAEYCERMSMTPDEPGIWEVTSFGPAEDLPFGPETIATLDRKGVKETEANARLISAAPDLLAACEACLVEMSAFAWFARAAGNSSHQATVLESVLRAAIQKARGEA